MKFEGQGRRHQPAARQHLRLRATSPAGKAAKGCATASSPALDERCKTARRLDANLRPAARQVAAAIAIGVERRQIVAVSIDFLLTLLALAFWAFG